MVNSEQRGQFKIITCQNNQKRGEDTGGQWREDD